MLPVFTFVIFVIIGVRSDTIRDTIIQYADKETWATLDIQAENWNDDLPPLHLAVCLNKYEACEYFIQSGTYLDAVDEFGASALLYATSANNLNIVNLLLESGINVNLRDNLGRAALHIAAQYGFVEIIKALMFNSNKLIKMKIKDNDGRSAFHYAAQGNQAEVIQILSYTETRRNEPDTRGKATPLHLAIVEGNRNAAHALAFIASYRLKNNAREELRLAAQYGRKSVLLSLQDHGFQLNGKDDAGNTVLFHAVNFENKGTSFDQRLAACEKSAEIVRALILMGANLNVINKDEKSAADIALEGGNYAAYSVIKKHVEIKKSRKGSRRYLPPLHYEMTESPPNMEEIRKLIRTKNIDETDHLGQSALHLAVSANNLVFVKELISAGCNIALKDGLGNTALHLAKSAEIAKTLLEADGNLANIVDDRGNLPLLLAVYHNRIEVAKILAPSTREIGADNNRFFNALDIAAAKLENYDLVDMLLKHGAGDNRNAKPRISSTLHKVSDKGKVKMTEYLLEKGLDPGVRNMSGSLPVVNAIVGGNVELIRILMKGVEPNTTNTFGFSLLHYAAMGVMRQSPSLQSPQEEAVKILVEEYGVPLNSLTYNGKTALMMAVRRGYAGIVKLLVSYGADVTLTNPKGKTALFYAVWNAWMNCVPILAHASRDMIHLKNSAEISPIDVVVNYTIGGSVKGNKLAAVNLELSPADIPDDKLRNVLGFFSKSFGLFVDNLTTPIAFGEYVKRGMEFFKNDNNLEEHATFERHVNQGMGIFYALAAAYYPELAYVEVSREETERFDKKREEYRNATIAFENGKNKAMYVKELRYMMVESFVEEKGREFFVGTYVNSIAQELVEDALVEVANNENVCQRVELLANSLMLACENRKELSALKGFLGGKMARLAEVVIPKYKFKI